MFEKYKKIKYPDFQAMTLLKQLHCYRNIHMYDFHDDAGHHHGSQCKQGIAFKRLDPSLAWALLGTLEQFYF